MAKKCQVYLAELARHNYVTPKSYLEFLSIFSSLIGKKKQELMTAKKRMKSGLDKVCPSHPGELWGPLTCSEQLTYSCRDAGRCAIHLLCNRRKLRLKQIRTMPSARSESVTALKRAMVSSLWGPQTSL